MDLPSDSDESDVDFVPDKNCSDGDGSISEDIDETENDGAAEGVKKGKKRSKKNKHGSTAKKLKNESNGVEKTQVDEKDNKKHEDDLWASFLKDPVTSETSKDKLEEGSSSSSNVSNTLNEDKSDGLHGNAESKNISEDDVSSNNPGTIDDKSRNVPIPKFPARPVRGGLSSVLSKLGKNNKLSTLEKSKKDWNSFKINEGIEEDISIHNRGREGYLERQDFLQRTDLRRFEIEKNLRTTKRSNR